MTARIACRTAASIAALCTIKDVTEADAKAIRAVWHTVGKRADARKQVDALLRTFGVEYLGTMRRTGQHVHYCNTGDTYAGTVLFIGTRLVVGCWGDLIETNAVRTTARF